MASVQRPNSPAVITRYVLILLGFILLALVLYRIRTIVAVVYVSLLIASTLHPVALFLQRWMPRVVAVILIYVILVGATVLLGLLIVPPLIIQIGSFLALLPGQVEEIRAFLETVDYWFRQAGVSLNLEDLLSQASSQIASLVFGLVRIPFFVYEVGASLFAILTLSFYWLLDRDRLLSSFVSLAPKASQQRWARTVYLRAEERLGVFVQGLLLSSAILGVATFIGLSILGVPFPLLLALVAAVLEVVPILGPVIAAVPIVGIALAQSPTLGLVTLLFWIGVQQLEGYLVTPIVQRQAVRLPPFTILVAILIGAALLGVLGALLAIPTAVLIAVLLYELSPRHEHHDQEEIP